MTLISENVFSNQTRVATEKSDFIPLVLPESGVTPNKLNLSFTSLNYPPRLLPQIQKLAVLNTYCIVKNNSQL
jgi:hypothetical protein